MEAMHANPISVPLDNDCLHVVVEDLDRYTPKGQERGLVAADQRLDPLIVAELDIGLAAHPSVAMKSDSLSAPRPTVAQSACI